MNGDLEASNFTSCYINYMSELVERNPGVKTIISWSDGCTYQNRCNILSSTLLNFSVQHEVQIFHKYFKVGHTHMECDSVHATLYIERALKHESVNLPADYVRIIKSARTSKPGKYNVKYVDFSFFNDFKDACDIKTIKPAKEVGPPYVTQYYNSNTHLI